MNRFMQSTVGYDRINIQKYFNNTIKYRSENNSNIEQLTFLRPDSTPNNVICESQKINVRKESYSGLIITGFNEFYGYEDIITMQNDGLFYESKFFLQAYNTAIHEHTYKYTCLPVCNIMIEADNVLYRKFIHYCVITFEQEIIFDTIELPFNDNIHVFSIYLKMKG